MAHAAIFLAVLLLVSNCAQNSQGPVSIRAIVAAIQVSQDQELVESITVTTEHGTDIRLTLREEIDQDVWSLVHLQGHVGLGQSLGIQIGIRYIETQDGKVALDLFE